MLAFVARYLHTSCWWLVFIFGARRWPLGLALATHIGHHVCHDALGIFMLALTRNEKGLLGAVTGRGDNTRVSGHVRSRQKGVKHPTFERNFRESCEVMA